MAYAPERLRGEDFAIHPLPLSRSHTHKFLPRPCLVPTQARSKRSRFITLLHAAAKSFTNASFESLHAYTSAIARSWEFEPKRRSTRVPVHLSLSVARSRP